MLLSRLRNSERNVRKGETRAESLKTSDEKHGQLKKVLQDFQKVSASITLRVQPPQSLTFWSDKNNQQTAVSFLFFYALLTLFKVFCMIGSDCVSRMIGGYEKHFDVCSA